MTQGVALGCHAEQDQQVDLWVVSITDETWICNGSEILLLVWCCTSIGKTRTTGWNTGDWEQLFGLSCLSKYVVM